MNILTAIFTLWLLRLQVVYAQFTVQPVPVVQAEGLEAVFECQYQTEATVTYDWFINGEVHTLDTSLVSARLPLFSGALASLRIVTTPLHNNTIVQCEAVIRNGTDRRFMLSPTASLTVFGIEISNFFHLVNDIIITWTDHNFTTDVSYCMDINQTVLGSTETVTLDPVCGLTGTQYTFSHPDHIVCDRFSFTVTPTEGGSRGTPSQPVTGFFTQVEGAGGDTVVSKSKNFSEKEVTFRENVTNCTTFTSYKVDSDLLMAAVHGTINESQSDISLTFSLPTDQQTNVTVTLTDINGVDLVFNDLPTRTFDIQEFSANNCSQPNTINVTLEYAMNSSAPGALVSFIPMKDAGSMDVANTQYSLLPRTNDPIERHEVVNVSSGSFKLFAFDIEDHSSGLFFVRPQTTAAATLDTVTIVTGEAMIPPLLPVNEAIEISSIDDDTVSLTYQKGPDNILVFAQSHENPMVLHGGETDEDGVIQVDVAGLLSYSIIALSWSSNDLSNARVSIIPADPLTPSPTSVPESETTMSDPLSFSKALSLGVSLVFCLVVWIVATVIIVVIIWMRRRCGMHRCKEYSIALEYKCVMPDTKSPPSASSTPSQATVITSFSDDEINNNTPKSLYSNCLPATTDQQKNDAKANESDIPEPFYDDTTQVNQSSKELQYAELQLKPKDDIATDALSDRKTYASIDMSKLAEPDPVEDSIALSAPPPTPPRPPTVDSMVATLDTIPERWWDLGEVLGISQHMLCSLRDNNQHDKIRLFHMVSYYFNNINSRPKWEDIARVLREIEEIETANKIERVNNLQGYEHPSGTSAEEELSWIPSGSVSPCHSVQESDHNASGTLVVSTERLSKDRGFADDDFRGMRMLVLSSAAECSPRSFPVPFASSLLPVEFHGDKCTPETMPSLDLEIIPSEFVSSENDRKMKVKYSVPVQETCSDSETRFVYPPLSQGQDWYKPVAPQLNRIVVVKREICHSINQNIPATMFSEHHNSAMHKYQCSSIIPPRFESIWNWSRNKLVALDDCKKFSAIEGNRKCLATQTRSTIPIKPVMTDPALCLTSSESNTSFMPQETVQEERTTQCIFAFPGYIESLMLLPKCNANIRGWISGLQLLFSSNLLNVETVNNRLNIIPE